VSADAETTLRRTEDRSRSFDLAHLNDVHERLFADVYPFAGNCATSTSPSPARPASRSCTTAGSRRTSPPLLTNSGTRTTSSTSTIPASGPTGPRISKRRCCTHTPTARATDAPRIWIEDLAQGAGHQLDWTRSSPDRSVHVAVAAAHGDYEPMRALLTVVAGGQVGVDRPLDALNDHDKLQHGQAWARTGMVFGSDADRATLTDQLRELGDRLEVVRFHLASLPERQTSTEQPASERWRGLATSILPTLPLTEDWPRFAGELDEGVAAGIDVAAELPRLAVRDAPSAADPGRPANLVKPAPTSPPVAPTDPRPDSDLAAAYRPQPPPGPRPGRGR
jgi:hypothetical protein